MLVLSRRRFESIQIGPDVRITIQKIEGNHVRIGIEAPGEVMILRGELAELDQPVGSRTWAEHRSTTALPIEV